MHRVVIVGGGFGGLYAAQALRRAPVDVTHVAQLQDHAMHSITFSTARASLKDVMDSARNDHEPVIIVRTGGPAVVMMSYEDYKSLEQLCGWNDPRAE